MYCCEQIRVSQLLSCSSCLKDHPGDYRILINKDPDIVLVAIGNLSETCIVCKKVGKLKDHKQHLESSCQVHYTASSDIATILEKPYL